jgi:dephospho-CoA kinase
MRAAGRALRIGLTGPIGCGKSTVAGWLSEAGARVIDADELARVVTAPGEPALAALRQRFGEEVFLPDGSLDRDALGELVFSDPAALRDLESIVHPEVRRRLELAIAAAAAAGAPLLVIEAIKLVEAGHARDCDEVWIVDCQLAIQRERLAQRGLVPDDMDRRIAAQGSDLAERLEAEAGRQLCDGCVRRLSTDGTREETRHAVLAALAEARTRRDQGAGKTSGTGSP